MQYSYALKLRVFSVLTLGLASVANAQRAPAELEEVVVTATKRAVSLQDVPLSMQAITGESLEAIGASEIDDYYRQVPNFAVVDRGIGMRQYSIRGISSGLVTQGASSVGVYLDEMPVSFGNFQPDPQLFDLQRVEVLRGPQGTLYGEGSIGGTLRMISTPPDVSAFHAKVDTSYSVTESGGDGHQLNGMLNLPLVDNVLALRLTALNHSSAGFIDRIARPDGVSLDLNALFGLPAGSVPIVNTGPLSGQKDINGEDVTAGRASLRWLPNDHTEIQLNLLTQQAKANDRNTEVAGVGDLMTNLIIPEKVNDQFDLANLTAKFTLEGAELMSSSSYYKRNIRHVFDTNDLGEGVVPGLRLPGSSTEDIDRQNIVSQEIRLTSTSKGKLDWILGGFYVRKDNGFDQILQDKYSAFLAVANFFGVPATDPRQLLDQTGRNEETQYALFGEVNYALTQKLKATVGLRYFNIKQKDTLINNGPNFLGLGLTDGVREASESNVIPKFSLSYAPHAHLLLWATASQGFRAGGTNTTPGILDSEIAYKSDTLWNYELGTRFSAFKNRLSVTSTLYYIKWSDIQLSVPLGTARATVNAGRARILGGELELLVRPLPALELGFNLGYNDGQLTEDTPTASGDTNPGFRGDRLPGVPNINLSAFAQYTVPLSVADLSAFARADVSHTGSSTTTFNALSTANGLPSYFTPPAYSLLNLRFGIEKARWSATLFVDNVANKRAIVLIDNAAVTERITRNRPRTVGIQARINF